MYKSLYPVMHHVIQFQFDSLESWLDHISHGIRRESKELEEKWNREMEGMSECDRSEYANWNSDEPWYLTEVFPRLFWQSAFVTIWSYFERELVDVCRKDISHEAPTFEEGELLADKCQKLEDVEKHLKKREVTMPQGWKELDTIRKVRNQIVHDGGHRYTSENPNEKAVKSAKRSKKVDEYVASRRNAGKTGLSFEHDTLVVAREFCVEVASLAKDCVLDVLKQIPETSEDHWTWKKMKAASKAK